jgi:hypothetical protein
MAYQPLVLNPSTPPQARTLIQHVEALSFNDIHSMLRLPLADYGITAGCNFAITHVLMSVIGGVSTTLYKQSGEVGTRFKGVLVDFFPWDLEPAGNLGRNDAAEAIYDVFRNPLTHDLGLDVKQKSKGIKVLVKRLKTRSHSGRDRGLTETYIEFLERAQTRPKMSATVTATAQKKILIVEGLYWGIRRMIERLSADQKLMAAAESFLANL